MPLVRVAAGAAASAATTEPAARPDVNTAAAVPTPAGRATAPRGARATTRETRATVGAGRLPCPCRAAAGRRSRRPPRRPPTRTASSRCRVSSVSASRASSLTPATAATIRARRATASTKPSWCSTSRCGSRSCCEKPGVEVVMTRRHRRLHPARRSARPSPTARARTCSSRFTPTPAGTPQARGVETYFLNFANNLEAEAVAARENAASGQTMRSLPDIVKAIALNNKLDESRDLAEMRAALDGAAARHRSNDELRDLGVKQAPFVVLIGAGDAQRAGRDLVRDQQAGRRAAEDGRLSPADRPGAARRGARLPAESLKKMNAVAGQDSGDVSEAGSRDRGNGQVLRNDRVSPLQGAAQPIVVRVVEQPRARHVDRRRHHRRRRAHRSAADHRGGAGRSCWAEFRSASNASAARAHRPRTPLGFGRAAHHLNARRHLAASRSVLRLHSSAPVSAQLGERADGDAGRPLRLIRLRPRPPTPCRRCRGAPTAGRRRTPAGTSPPCTRRPAVRRS